MVPAPALSRRHPKGLTKTALTVAAPAAPTRSRIASINSKQTHKAFGRKREAAAVNQTKIEKRQRDGGKATACKRRANNKWN